MNFQGKFGGYTFATDFFRHDAPCSPRDPPLSPRCAAFATVTCFRHGNLFSPRKSLCQGFFTGPAFSFHSGQGRLFRPGISFSARHLPAQLSKCIGLYAGWSRVLNHHECWIRSTNERAGKLLSTGRSFHTFNWNSIYFMTRHYNILSSS